MGQRKLSAEVLQVFREWGRSGGLIGGKKAAKNMTPEQRSARAKKAGLAAAGSRKAKSKKTNSK